MREVWGIILAAGESKRMKVQKLLLPYEGSTMIEKVILNVKTSGIDKIMIITGSESEKMVFATGKLPVQHCLNRNYKRGMLSSVKCGFKSLPLSCGAAMVFLGDQPMINVLSINAVIEGYKNTDKGIVVPVYRGKRGHPLLVDMKYRNEIDGLDEKEGLRAILSMFHEDVLEVQVNDPGILRDIDTKEEYENEINKTQ